MIQRTLCMRAARCPESHRQTSADSRRADAVPLRQDRLGPTPENGIEQREGGQA